MSPHKRIYQDSKRLLQFTAMTVTIIFLAASHCHAQQNTDDAQKNLENIKKQIEETETNRKKLENKAGQAETSARHLSENLIGLAKEIRTTENSANSLEADISALEIAVEEKLQILSIQQSELTDLIAALTQLSRRPPAAILLKPGETLGTARGAAVMGELVPVIKKRADALKADLGDLQKLNSTLSAQRFDLKNTLESLQKNQVKLSRLRDLRTIEAAQTRARAGIERTRLQKLIKEAQTLERLIENLEAEAKHQAQNQRGPTSVKRPAGLSDLKINQVKGKLIFPAAGHIIHSFGDTSTTPVSQGITVSLRGSAQVVSPYDGQIVFTGNYRGYGQLLIIEHAGGYHSLLSGFGTIYVGRGQWVLAGEPVGAMPKTGNNPADNNSSNNSSNDSGNNSGNDSGKNRPNLYLEMRKGRKPINPLPWFSKESRLSR